jgi:hypothetical protein
MALYSIYFFWADSFDVVAVSADILFKDVELGAALSSSELAVHMGPPIKAILDPVLVLTFRVALRRPSR